MIIELYYLFFFISTVLGVVAVVSPLGSSSQKISSPIAFVLFTALGMQSFDIKRVYVLEVNQTLMQHITTISDTSFAYVCYGLAVIMFVIAFVSNLLVLREVE